jgi:hypothetical protein
MIRRWLERNFVTGAHTLISFLQLWTPRKLSLKRGRYINVGSDRPCRPAIGWEAPTDTNILYRVGGTCRVYRLHHSIVHTLLLPTPRVGITIIPLHTILTPWCLVSERSLDVLTPRRLADNWLTSRRNIWLSARLSLKYLRSDGCVACVPTIHPLLRCVGNVGIRNQLLHSSFNNRLPSRCLGMDFLFIASCCIAVSICVSRACHNIFTGQGHGSFTC